MAPAFCSQQVKQFLQEYGGGVRLRCVYVLSGNIIVERSHRSIKKIAARKRCTILEDMCWYWYHAQGRCVPGNRTCKCYLQGYRVREKGIHALQVAVNEEKRGAYVVIDIVWIKPPDSRCTTKFKLGRVVSHHSVEVNGVLQYIKDLRTLSGADSTARKWNRRQKSVSGGRNSNYDRAYFTGRYSRHHQAGGGWLLDRSKFVWGWRSHRPAQEEHSREEAHPKLYSVQQRRSAGGERNTSCVRTCPTGRHFERHQAECRWEWRSCRLTQEEHSTEEVRSELHRGRKMSVEAFPIDTKECAHVLPFNCAKRANSVDTSVVSKPARLRVVIWRSRGRVFIRVQRRKVLKSGQITDHRV